MIQITINFIHNKVIQNKEYGIRIAVTATGVQPSFANLLSSNDMSMNGINAFDSSARAISEDEINRLIMGMSWSKSTRQMMRNNSQYRQQIIAAYRKSLKPYRQTQFKGRIYHRLQTPCCR
jgi:hypothetical protein